MGVALNNMCQQEVKQIITRCIEPVKTDPFLRWAGSKRKVLPRLVEYWRSDYRRYIEPFVGCAALFFRLQPPVAVLGDINTELIEAYEVVRENPDTFHEALVALPTGEEQYYRIRREDPGSLSKFCRAVRFVYLNRHCFNGIYRTNNEGRFSEGWWRAPHTGEAKPSANIETGAWAKILKEVETFLDLKVCKKKCPLIRDGLIAGARGVTDPRNLTSHRPNDLKTIIQRDKKLRTWFESTSDLLKSWYEATRPLKL
jgi:hypothetical protein